MCSTVPPSSPLVPALAALSIVAFSSVGDAQVLEMVAHIDHDEVQQPTGSRARGRGRFHYDAAADTLEFFIEYGGLEGVEFAAHLHTRTCAGSPRLLGLPPGNPKSGVLTIPDDLECELLAGLAWVNIHTDLHQGGEIAGFVVPVPDTLTAYCPGVGCPCANDDAGAGCANSSGAGGRLTTRGTGSVLHDRLELVAEPLPAGEMGIFFMGAGADRRPFGDGLLCVDGALWRFAAGVSNGVLRLGPGLVGISRRRLPPEGAIRVGSTWHFQAWYRDGAGPCGSGFNFTDAITVSFTF